MGSKKSNNNEKGVNKIENQVQNATKLSNDRFC